MICCILSNRKCFIKRIIDDSVTHFSMQRDQFIRNKPQTTAMPVLIRKQKPYQNRSSLAKVSAQTA